MVPYAHKRFKLHINRFTRIYNDMMGHKIDKEWLSEVEYRDNLFSNMDCGKYYTDEFKTNINRKITKSKCGIKSKCMVL